MASSSASRQNVKLFRHKGGQAVPIPEGFELEGEDATIRKEGTRLVIEAARTDNADVSSDSAAKAAEPDSLVAYFRSLPPLDVDLEPIPDLPAEPVEL